MSIEIELEKAEQSIAADSYSMSVGELISSYKSGEIVIHPEFQRFFRWNDFQKTRLIESFLLGLPIPPIFVFQKSTGIWELIDGLQRVSTILQFVGELKNKNGKPVKPLSLTECKYLPSLNGATWKNSATIPDQIKLRFRKSRIDVKIILPKSNEISKFELFDRLNTGGSQATAQEVRNCLIIMQNPDFFEWVDTLSKYPGFSNTIPLTEKQISEQYNLELLIRFLILQSTPAQDVKKINDLETFLNEQSIEIASDENYDKNKSEEIFKFTFDTLNDLYNDGAFKKPKEDNAGHFSGPFLLAAFEVIAMGIANNYDLVKTKNKAWIRSRVEKLWRDNEIKSTGRSAASRLGQTIPLGRKTFK